MRTRILFTLSPQFHALGGGSTDLDDEFAFRSMDNFAAFILGRNMFGPVRVPWLDNTWKGWWGDNPPYHAPTFVLTHHERKPLVMQGGTAFHFVTAGIEEASRLAKQVAGDKDVKIGRGRFHVRQYLQAELYVRVDCNAAKRLRTLREAP